MRGYDPIDDAQVEDLLSDLPSDILETYDRMLLRMNENKRHQAIRALAWIAFSPETIV
jgi:hypothetical protein